MATVPHVNLLKVNEVELALLAGSEDLDAASQALLEKGPDLVVGDAGSGMAATSVWPREAHSSPPSRCKQWMRLGAGMPLSPACSANWWSTLSGATSYQSPRMRQNLRYANAVGP